MIMSKLYKTNKNVLLVLVKQIYEQKEKLESISNKNQILNYRIKELNENIKIIKKIIIKKNDKLNLNEICNMIICCNNNVELEIFSEMFYIKCVNTNLLNMNIINKLKIVIAKIDIDFLFKLLQNENLSIHIKNICLDRYKEIIEESMKYFEPKEEDYIEKTIKYKRGRVI